MAQTARRAVVASLIFVAVVALALALWKLRLLIALLFLALVVAAAMRPGVDWLKRHRVPRAVGVALHYLVFAGLFALLLWLVVPRALDQVGKALGGDVPTSQQELRDATNRTSGVAHTVLQHVQNALEDVPGPGGLLDPALHWTQLGLEIGFGIFFTLAAAAYWIFERDRVIALVATILPTKRRSLVVDTWRLIDLRLGAYVRGQLLLIALVGATLSFAFWLIGLPYWLLLGVYAGIVEIIPIVGPLIAGAAAVGVGLSVSWQHGLAAGLVVLAVRLLEDYVVIPRVLGHAVGLSPLFVLVSVAGTAILFGEATILLAIPLAAVIATLFDVLVLNRDPGDQDAPAVLFPSREKDAVSG
jgi:predicted PurR-regulated permease PerM